MDLTEEPPTPEVIDNSEDELGRINNQRAEVALRWLKDMWKTPQICPICSVTNWTVGNVLELRPYNHGNLIIGGEVFPISPVTCLNCGYTFFLNGIISKAVVNPEQVQDNGGNVK